MKPTSNMICDDGWLKHSFGGAEKCWKLLEKSTASYARERCLDVGGELILPTSDRENRDMKRIMTAFGVTTYVHLRATDVIVEGEWTDSASDQPITYTHWKPTQPDNWGGIMHYAISDTNGNWIDEKSWFSAHPLCQKLDKPGCFYVTLFVITDFRALGSRRFLVHFQLWRS